MHGEWRNHYVSTWMHAPALICRLLTTSLCKIDTHTRPISTLRVHEMCMHKWNKKSRGTSTDVTLWDIVRMREWVCVCQICPWKTNSYSPIEKKSPLNETSLTNSAIVRFVVYDVIACDANFVIAASCVGVEYGEVRDGEMERQRERDWERRRENGICIHCD